MNITAPFILGSIGIGDSVAVEGACLTVTAFDDCSFSADVSEETLKLTTLSELRAGSPVNLERALTLQKPLGGHLVTGHVDGVGSIRLIEKRGDNFELTVEVPEELTNQIVKKGSIAVDGISLTVAELIGSNVKAAIIPHTLKNTTLSRKSVGSKVNIETDIIGKYVERFLGSAKKGVTEGFLAEHGFLKKK